MWARLQGRVSSPENSPELRMMAARHREVVRVLDLVVLGHRGGHGCTWQITASSGVSSGTIGSRSYDDGIGRERRVMMVSFGSQHRARFGTYMGK